MYQFDFWYAYFDSRFLHFQKTLNSSFVNMQISPNPSVSTFTKLLQRAFLNVKNFHKSLNAFKSFIVFWSIKAHGFKVIVSIVCCKICNQTLIQFQYFLISKKNMANNFGILKDEFNHLFATFSLYSIFLFIHQFQNSMTQQQVLKNQINSALLQKVWRYKSINIIQQLVNKILPQMNSIIKFLYQEQFIEQKKLTILFLQDIKQVLLNLPTLSKKKIKTQFQLTKYLQIIIPIELSKNLYKFKPKRKKAYTMFNQNNKKYSSLEFTSNFSKNKFFQKGNQSINNLPLSEPQKTQKGDAFRVVYSKNKISKDMENDLLQQQGSMISQKFPKIFQFSQKVRKYSFHLNKAKTKKITLHTRQTLTIQAIEKQRKKSDYAKTNKSLSRQKILQRSFSISKQKKIFLNEGQASTRSKKSSLQLIHKNIEIEGSQKLRNHVQISPAKQMKKMHLNKGKIMRKVVEEMGLLEVPRKEIELEEGKTRGWGIVQEQVNKRIARRKIQQLIKKELDDDT